MDRDNVGIINYRWRLGKVLKKLQTQRNASSLWYLLEFFSPVNVFYMHGTYGGELHRGGR